MTDFGNISDENKQLWARQAQVANQGVGRAYLLARRWRKYAERAGYTQQLAVHKLYEHLFEDPATARHIGALDNVGYSFLSAADAVGTMNAFTFHTLSGCKHCIRARADFLFGLIDEPDPEDTIQ